MCGIIGCCGVEGAAHKLIAGLERLEYRGYDSAGIAVINNQGKIEQRKKQGRVLKLKESIQKSGIDGNIGIGHTRWATHGAPSDRNAHPHTCGRFSVVHNGIIENHSELKEKYLKLTEFESETDTEVIAKLLNRLYNSGCLNAISETAKLLKGSFALTILCEDEPEKLFCVRKASPLLVGIGNGGYAASDLSALPADTSTFYRMEDEEIAVINNKHADFYTFSLNKITKQPNEFPKSDTADERGKFEHYMLKEIYEQPQAIRKTVNKYLTKDGINLSIEMPAPEHFYIVACGSAYHAGLVGKQLFEKLLKTRVSVETASEFRYSSPIIGSKTPVIIISQSGETADSLAALRMAKGKGAKTISIVNVVHSSIAAESDCVIYTQAGPEIAVATTKAYSAQLASLYILAIYFAKAYNTASIELITKLEAELKQLHKNVEKTLACEEEIKVLAKELKDIEHAYFIGRGLGFCAAAEGSLKLKEISYIHSEAYAAGEMKHGTISLIENGTAVVAMDTQPQLTAKLQSNIDEVRSRGAKVTAISNEEKITADKIITVPCTNPLFAVSTQIVPVQLLSYHIARLRGCDIDKPRNLAKSVTVE